MLEEADFDDLASRDVYDAAGDLVGKAERVLIDDSTNTPEWIAVTTGLFGMTEVLIPVVAAAITDGRLSVSYDKGFVTGGPLVADSSVLSAAEEQSLYEYYGLQPRS